MRQLIINKVNELLNSNVGIKIGSYLSNWIIRKDSEKIRDFLNKNTFGESNIQKIYNIYYEINNPPKCENKNCSNFTEFINFSKGYRKTCSKECTCMIKYGCKSSFGSAEQHKKANDTKIKKYGGIGAGSKQTRAKMVNTMVKKYGTIYQKTPEYIEKCKNTCLEKYGEDHFLKTEDGKEKLKNNIIKKYGQHYSTLDSYKKLARNNYFKLNLNKKMVKAKNDKFYDKLYNYSIDNGYQPLFTNDEYLSFRDKKKNKYFKYKFKCLSCEYEFEIILSNIKRDGINCPKCNKKIKSLIQHKLFNKIIEKYNNFTFIEDEARVLDKHQQIDIYCEEKRFGIEYNGNCWHAQKFNNRGKDYHFNKFLNFEKNNVNVLNFWSDEFDGKQERIYELIDICISNDLQQINEENLTIGIRNNLQQDLLKIFNKKLFSYIKKTDKFIVIKNNDNINFILKFNNENGIIFISEIVNFNRYKLTKNVFNMIKQKLNSTKLLFQFDNRLKYYYMLITNNELSFIKYIEPKFYKLGKIRSNILNQDSSKINFEKNDIIWNYGESLFEI